MNLELHEAMPAAAAEAVNNSDDDTRFDEGEDSEEEVEDSDDNTRLGEGEDSDDDDEPIREAWRPRRRNDAILDDREDSDDDRQWDLDEETGGPRWMVNPGEVWRIRWGWVESVLVEDATLLESDEEEVGRFALLGNTVAQQERAKERAKELRMATLDDDENEAREEIERFTNGSVQPLVVRSEENINRKILELSAKRSSERRKALLEKLRHELEWSKIRESLYSCAREVAEDSEEEMQVAEDSDISEDSEEMQVAEDSAQVAQVAQVLAQAAEDSEEDSEDDQRVKELITALNEHLRGKDSDVSEDSDVEEESEAVVEEELWERARELQGVKEPRFGAQIQALIQTKEAEPARTEARLHRYTQFVRGLRWRGPQDGHMEARYVGYNTRVRFRASLDWSTFKWSLAREDELIEFEDIVDWSVDWSVVKWQSISTASTLEKLFHRCPETARRGSIAQVCSQLTGSDRNYSRDYYGSDEYLSGGWGKWSVFLEQYLRKPKEHFSKAFMEQHWELFKFHHLCVQQHCPENVLFDALVESRRSECDDWKYASARMVLPDDFIRQHAYKVDWHAICRFQNVSHELLMEFRGRVVLDDLYHSKFIKYETVRTFFHLLRRREPTEAIKRVIKEAHLIRDLTTLFPLVVVKRVIEYIHVPVSRHTRW